MSRRQFGEYNPGSFQDPLSQLTYQRELANQQQGEGPKPILKALTEIVSSDSKHNKRTSIAESKPNPNQLRSLDNLESGDLLAIQVPFQAEPLEYMITNSIRRQISDPATWTSISCIDISGTEFNILGAYNRNQFPVTLSPTITTESRLIFTQRASNKNIQEIIIPRDFKSITATRGLHGMAVPVSKVKKESTQTAKRSLNFLQKIFHIPRTLEPNQFGLLESQSSEISTIVFDSNHFYIHDKINQTVHIVRRINVENETPIFQIKIYPVPYHFALLPMISNFKTSPEFRHFQDIDQKLSEFSRFAYAYNISSDPDLNNTFCLWNHRSKSTVIIDAQNTITTPPDNYTYILHKNHITAYENSNTTDESAIPRTYSFEDLSRMINIKY